MSINKTSAQINAGLRQLGANFRAEAPRPLFEDAEAYISEHGAMPPALTEMLAGNAASKLYAAILLSAFDAEAAEKALSELRHSNVAIRVQNRVGHGSVEVAVKYAADSFLTSGTIDDGLVGVAARLEAWRRDSKSGALSATDSILEKLDSDPDGARKAVAHLAESPNAFDRFYAACVLGALGRGEEVPVLESLLTDETPVKMMLGDIAMPFPAKDVASAMLEGRELPLEKSDNANAQSAGLLGAIRRIFKT